MPASDAPSALNLPSGVTAPELAKAGFAAGLTKPEFVLLLGGASAKLVLGSHDGIMKLRGRWRDVDFGDGVPRPVMASLHPAYLLRSPTQKRLAFHDLLLLAKRLGAMQSNDESG